MSNSLRLLRCRWRVSATISPAGVSTTTAILPTAVWASILVALLALALALRLVLLLAWAKVLTGADGLVSPIGINLVSRRETNFQFDDFVPLGIGPLALRNGEHLAQTLTKFVFGCVHRNMILIVQLPL